MSTQAIFTRFNHLKALSLVDGVRYLVNPKLNVHHEDYHRPLSVGIKNQCSADCGAMCVESRSNHLSKN